MFRYTRLLEVRVHRTSGLRPGLSQWLMMVHKIWRGYRNVKRAYTAKVETARMSRVLLGNNGEGHCHLSRRDCNGTLGNGKRSAKAIAQRLDRNQNRVHSSSDICERCSRRGIFEICYYRNELMFRRSIDEAVECDIRHAHRRR